MTNVAGRPRPPAVAFQLEDGTWLVPRFVVAEWAQATPDAVRRRCQPIACDVATRTTFYDPDAVLAAFSDTRERVSA